MVWQAARTVVALITHATSESIKFAGSGAGACRRSENLTGTARNEAQKQGLAKSNNAKSFTNGGKQADRVGEKTLTVKWAGSMSLLMLRVTAGNLAGGRALLCCGMRLRRHLGAPGIS